MVYTRITMYSAVEANARVFRMLNQSANSSSRARTFCWCLARKRDCIFRAASWCFSAYVKAAKSSGLSFFTTPVLFRQQSSKDMHSPRNNNTSKTMRTMKLKLLSGPVEDRTRSWKASRQGTVIAFVVVVVVVVLSDKSHPSERSLTLAYPQHAPSTCSDDTIT